MQMKQILLGLSLILCVITFVAGTAAASSQQQAQHAVVRYPVNAVTTRPLRFVPELPDVVHDVRKLERKMLPNRLGSADNPQADAVQDASSGPSVAAIGASFDGLDNRNGVLPPDTVGVIGPNHFVQMTNLSFAVYDRSGGVLYGPVNSNTLWNPLGGVCATNNDGDPIVLYDQAADRWLASQFALPNYPRGPFYQCIAVSQTGDPTGAWHLYTYLISNTQLNDYPKFGVWPDGYYMSINQYKCKVIGCTWAGQGVVAFERDKMLSGDSTARMLSFDLFSTDSNLGGMLPADWDGVIPPPTGAPNNFVQLDDDSWGYSPDQLQIWNFHVDWSNTANSSFSLAQTIPTANFDSNLCGYARNCIPQPSGVKVDALSDRLMYRLQYRNFGSDQAPDQVLVTNHTVDVGSNHAGVRWYDLRNTGSGWSVKQQGTYAPDSDHRWMGSVAMNGAGDIGLGYSIASTTTYPSIRFTGRLNSDTLGQMTQGEGTIVNGGGSQSHSTGRWGDYSTMSVDPVDDCTFWYTQEYYSVNSSAGWKTRIGSFKLAVCDSDGDGLSDSVENQIGTNPNLADTDGDGISDYDELNRDGDSTNYTQGVDTDPGSDPNTGIDPNVADPKDTDADGFTDGEEDLYNSDPLLVTDTPANGDVNEDGTVDVADILVTVQIALGMIPDPTPAQIIRADVAPLVNGIPARDMEINAGDILRVQTLALMH